MNCSCGRSLKVPARPAAFSPQAGASETYDIVQEPLLEELPPSPLQAPRQAQTLAYESIATTRRITWGDLARHPDAKKLLGIGLVIAVGIGFRFCVPLFVTGTGNSRSGAGFALILMGLVISVVTMLLGVGIVTKMTGADIGSVPVTVLKLCAIAVFGSIVFAVIAALLSSDDLRGMILAWHVVLLFNWIMFSMMFHFDLQESLFAVALVGILQAIAACALWHH